jgi:hypothetical protein
MGGPWSGLVSAPRARLNQIVRVGALKGRGGKPKAGLPHAPHAQAPVPIVQPVGPSWVIAQSALTRGRLVEPASANGRQPSPPSVTAE